LLAILLENGVANGAINTLGPIAIRADYGLGQFDGNVTALSDITIYNVGWLEVTIQSTGSGIINIANCLPIDRGFSGAYAGLPNIDSVGSTVYATRSLINNVTNAGTLNLKDSRVIGTNNATSTVYADVLLKMADFDGSTLPTSDPLVVGRLWNNAGTIKVSAG
jgi:hypothetical protein